MTPEERAKNFLQVSKTLVLATVGKNGTPTVSYAPYVRLEKDLYVYTSALSRHTRDMKENPDPGMSAMVIEDETRATNIFARKRITFSCNVTVVSRQSEQWSTVINLFEKTFGDNFTPIRPLGDFTLFCLAPFEAVYVEGFGAAYRMDGNLSLPVHIRGTGPGAEAHQDKKVESTYGKE